MIRSLLFFLAGSMLPSMALYAAGSIQGSRPESGQDRLERRLPGRPAGAKTAQQFET